MCAGRAVQHAERAPPLSFSGAPCAAIDHLVVFKYQTLGLAGVEFGLDA